MIFNNNIKKFLEITKANIDRLIVSSHFNFHLNHLKMHNPKCKSRKGKSRFEVCTGIKHDDWLDMVMGHKMRLFRCYVDADHKKQEILNQQFAA